MEKQCWGGRLQPSVGGKSESAMRTWGEAWWQWRECWVLTSSEGCTSQHASCSPSPFILTTLPIRCYSPHLPDGDTEAQGGSVTCQAHRAVSSTVGIHLQVQSPHSFWAQCFRDLGVWPHLTDREPACHSAAEKAPGGGWARTWRAVGSHGVLCTESAIFLSSPESPVPRLSLQHLLSRDSRPPLSLGLMS